MRPCRVAVGRGRWGAEGGEGDLLAAAQPDEVHTDLLALASFQGVPRGSSLLPPVLCLRPGKRHHHVLCACRPGEEPCWVGP